jgi:hypothetical protein
MAWWKRTRKTEPEAKTSEPPPQPATDAERIMRWRRHFQALDARRAAERARQETVDAEQRARRNEAERERIAAIIARNGSYFPTDELEDLRQPPGEFEPLEGELGARGFGWWRFPR